MKFVENINGLLINIECITMAYVDCLCQNIDPMIKLKSGETIAFFEFRPLDNKDDHEEQAQLLCKLAMQYILEYSDDKVIGYNVLEAIIYEQGKHLVKSLASRLKTYDPEKVCF